MHCVDLVSQLRNRLPDEPDLEILRFALLALNACAPGELDAPEKLDQVLSALRLQYRSATDQLAAVAHELRSTASFEPNRFDPQQIWTLVRAIKVHNHLLSFYLPASHVESKRRTTSAH